MFSMNRLPSPYARIVAMPTSDSPKREKMGDLVTDSVLFSSRLEAR